MILMQSDSADIAFSPKKYPSYPGAVALEYAKFPIGPAPVSTERNPSARNQVRVSAPLDEIKLSTLVTLGAVGTLLPAVQLTLIQKHKNTVLLENVVVSQVLVRHDRGDGDGFVDFVLAFTKMTYS